MATSVKDSLISLRKKLERTLDDDGVLRIIHKLSKVPITLDLLQGTGAGKMIRTLAKKEGTVGTKACSLLNKWREVLASPPEKQLSSLKENAHPKATVHSSSTDKLSKIVEIRLKPKHSKEKDDSKKESKKEPKEHKHLKEDITKEKHMKETKSSHRENSKHSTSVHKKQRITESDDSEHSKHSTISVHEKQRITELDDSEHSKHSITNVHKKQRITELDDSKHSKHSTTNVHKKQRTTEFDDSKHSKHSTSSAHKKQRITEIDYSKSLQLSLLKDDFINGKCSDFEDLHYSDSSSNGITALTDSPVKESKPSKSSITSSKSNHSKDIKSEHSHKHKLSKEHKNRTDLSQKVEKVKSPKKVNGVKSEEKLKKLSKKMKSSEEFTSSEISFEDCLMFNDIVPSVKKRKSSKPLTNSVEKKVKSFNKMVEDEKIKHQIIDDPMEKLFMKASNKVVEEEILLNLPEISKVDIMSTLPQTQPNYRPLPHRSYETSPLKKKAMSNEEAIKFTTSRREKTAVYSGKKNCFLTSVPTLFECCTRVLIENIDDIEYMGEIPYFLLESMLKRCSATQLYRIEHYNPYLLEDTNALWEKHCKRDYRCAKLQDSETWRELYWRSFEEQERKLKSVTANISASIASSNPMRKAKLAYVDSVAKPPRDVARRQAKHGTALPVHQPVKAGPPSKASPRPTTPVINAAAVASASTSRAPRVEVIKPIKPRIAPLMAKTLKSMKQCFRR